MKLKDNRPFSFLIMALIYILTTIFGVFVFKILNFDLWLNLLITDILATIFVFAFSLIFKNASVYDPYWSVQPIVITGIMLTVYKTNALSILFFAVILFWGIRLTANWAYCFYNLNSQDWRYTMLHEKTGKFYPIINFVGIHLVPTLVVYLCTLPAVYVIVNSPRFNVFSVLALLISVFAVVIQGTADIQMHKYKKHKNSTFIRVGLWKYSRHPNYLGEILMWWGIGLSFVIAMPNMWYLLAGAIANTLLFMFVSIPLAEGKQKLKPGYDEYKKQDYFFQYTKSNELHQKT